MALANYRGVENSTQYHELKRAEADRLILNKLESTEFSRAALLMISITCSRSSPQPGTGRNAQFPDAELARYLDEAKKSALKTKALTAQLLTFAEGGAPIRRPTLLRIDSGSRPAGRERFRGAV